MLDSLCVSFHFPGTDIMVTFKGVFFAEFHLQFHSFWIHNALLMVSGFKLHAAEIVMKQFCDDSFNITLKFDILACWHGDCRY